MEKQTYFLYCHFFLEPLKGVIKTVKIHVENLDVHIIELKQAITRHLEEKNLKDMDSPLFKIMTVTKSLNTRGLNDTVKIGNYFENKGDVYCQVEAIMQPKKVTKTLTEEEKIIYKTLTNYSFYEATKQVVKVLVPLPGIQNVPKENIVATFTEKSLDVRVKNVNGLNYMFAVPRLDAKIIPEKSEALAGKDGNLIIRLRKYKEDDHWSYLYQIRYAGETEYKEK
jgi:calcyclin binding protein